MEETVGLIIPSMPLINYKCLVLIPWMDAGTTVNAFSNFILKSEVYNFAIKIYLLDNSKDELFSCVLK